MINGKRWDMSDRRPPTGPGEPAAGIPVAGTLDAQLDRAVPSEGANAFLLVVAGGQHGRVHPLNKNTMVIGRADQADTDIKVGDRSVSGQHARIINGSTGFELEDLASTNGTFVGGRQVSRCRLKSGDRLRIGGVEFAFLLANESEATIPLLPPPPAHTGVAAGRSHEEEEAPSARDLVLKAVQGYQLVRRHVGVIFLCAVGGAAVGAATALLVPPAPAALCEVKLKPDVRANPVETEFRPPNQDTPQFFAGAEKAFANPELIRTTLLAAGQRDPAPGLVEAVESRLQFSTMGDHIYTARFQDTLFRRTGLEPVIFLTAHMKNYIQSEIDKTLKALNGQVEFLRAQLGTVEKEVSQVDADLLQFREKNVEQLPEQATQTHASRFQMESRRSELQAQVRRLAGDLESLKRQLSGESSLAQTRLRSSEGYRDAVGTLNRNLSEARARGLGENHPEVRRLREEKKAIERLLDQQLGNEPSMLERRASPEYQELRQRSDLLEAQLRAARAELGEVDRDVRHVRRLQGAFPRVEAKLQELTYLHGARQSLRGQLFDRLKKAEIQLELERVSVSSRYELLTAPRLDRPRLSKTLLRRTAIGLAVGLVLTGLIIGAREGRRYLAELRVKGNHRALVVR